jgi:hypothetical protein
MPPATAPMRESELDDLRAVQVPLTYLAPDIDRAEVRVYPPSSGLATVRPASLQHVVAIRDARPIASHLDLDASGFEFHSHSSAFHGFYDERAVRQHYYPEVAEALKAFTGARDAVVFDHNVRSAVRAARGELGVRVPVDQAHNDYTLQSGPKRKREILDEAGRAELADRHFAFVNLWRPIVGPVHDNPLAVCDARSVAPADLVPTDIHHYGEDDLETPRHSGQIYSLRHNPAHRWFYASAMQPYEVLLLKGYDSRADGRACFMPHTGFRNPDCPTDFVPRESIEARALVVFGDRA